jgi:16S rRNA C1402 N4-methylase RsmH
MNGRDLKKEFGDYQTPDFFAEIVCSLLQDKLGVAPSVVIEPTSGVGNFLNAALNSFDTIEDAIGLEINPNYCAECQKRITDKRLKVINDNFIRGQSSMGNKFRIEFQFA